MKEQIIKDFQLHNKDTGSIELQVALLTDRIKHLTQHLNNNAKDFSTKRGLLVLVGKRRRFLKYIENSNYDQYKNLIERLGLRK